MPFFDLSKNLLSETHSIFNFGMTTASSSTPISFWQQDPGVILSSNSNSGTLT